MGIGDQGESINRVQIEKIVAETVAKTMPIMLTSFLASTGFQPQQIVNQAPQPEREGTSDSSPPPLRSERFYSKESSTTITDDLIELSRKAFSTALSREKWLELVQSYPTIKDTDSFLIAPKLEAGMKEALHKHHGHLKTKAILAFDEGLAEQQAPIVMVAALC